MKQQFKANLQPPASMSSGMLFALLAGGFFLFFFLGSKMNLALLACLAGVIVSAMFLWKKAHCVLTIDKQELVIEVVSAGLNRPAGVTTFQCKNLLTYSYNNWSEDTDLRLQWKDGTTHVFTDGDIKAIHRHLCKLFPEKEK